jgi:thiamine pyrophosphate-dependent acetolactate synthase large subunit-like protein
VTETSAGRAVVDLEAESVRHVFGIVGSLDVLDVLHDDKGVKYINVRHEQGRRVHG